MNEILARKYIKKVMSYGIPKQMAKEIVETSIETSKGKNLEMYINYSIDLVYGLGFTKRVAKNI
ncbi:hypothetical protein PQE75_gp058 [Bacillus phage vB_BcoS-136]|uniref:Uncharacterized protein n=1 Tax=Bacillus phage vB_BcoS-136 TaxID=2419619 RepID=A0A3G3BVM1_9CAUD|nr:hypothetical protein PQE75_gp058 [Bacillus phage vB_BcoS-136]AYP68190.1 hypothetical protein vBBcoS136_00058 [Bacillus phage vB_BcoS-136]